MYLFSGTRVCPGHSPCLAPACDPRATSPTWIVSKSHQKSQNRLFTMARDLADMARALVRLVGEREVLGGDRLRSLQGLRRPADQQPDVGETHLQQPGAEPVLPRPKHYNEF